MIGRGLVLTLAGVGLGLAARAGTVSTGPNPHGVADGCTACHAPGASPTEAGDVLPITETCRGCHPTADMHPVGVPSVDVNVPERFPMTDGVLTCATCHAEPAHEGMSGLEEPWHRGGPYSEARPICYQCHDREEYVRADPHHPAAWRSPEDPTCSACHTTAPDEGASPENSKLRLPLGETCTTCHVGTLHLGVITHVGADISEIPGGSRSAEQLAPVAVTVEGKVECWSCHNVHGATEAGVAPLARRWKGRRALADELHASLLADEWVDLPPDVSWPGSPDDEHPPLLSLPIENGALCRACHGDGP